MLTKSLICLVLISATIVQTNPIKAASRIDRSAHDSTDFLDINYHITHDLSGHPVKVHESKGAHKKGEDEVDEKSKGGLGGFLQNFGKSVNDAIDEGVNNHGKKIDSFLGIGRAALNSVQTGIDSKIKLVASVPKIGTNTLEHAGRK